MRKCFITFTLIFFIFSGISAQITFSGILDSTVSAGAGAGDAPNFLIGIEEFANLRFQARIRERATVHCAVNLIAAAGSYASDAALLSEMSADAAPHGMNTTAYYYGQNFMFGIELERLYFRLRGEYVDLDGGLFRLPFGYGQVWGPSDFLNPKNPLKPDARPRGILGAAVTWYPIDEIKLLGFYAAPQNIFSQEGKGSFFGISMDQHWDNLSIQGVYSFETPKDGSIHGTHRAGFSFKTDIEVGILIDMLYTFDYEQRTKLDGLSFSMGMDYSFIDGNLIVLAEYLYNGKKSSTALGYGGSFSNNHYLYYGMTWRFNDFTNTSLAVIYGFNDVSFTPIISVNHDLFQGAVLTVSAQVPMDRDFLFKDGRRGELGPLPPGSSFGSYFNCSVRLRLRF
jgi:hypothetical protein